jgi:hypothetical protein
VRFDAHDALDLVDRAGIGAADAALISLALDETNDDYVLVESRKGRRAYLFAFHQGALRMALLRPPVRTALPLRSAMCSVCHVVLPAGEVGLWTNRPVGDRHHVVGDWICLHLECKDRLAGRIVSPRQSQLGETVSPEWRHQRMLDRLDRLMGRWLAASHVDASGE